MSEQQAVGTADIKAGDAKGLSQPLVALHIMLIGVFMLFANRISVQVMVDYFSFDYGLNDSARRTFVSVAYAVMIVGQLCVAFLCDRYIGVVRSLRISLCISVIALAGLALCATDGAARFYHAGKSYEVGALNTTMDIVQYVKIDGETLSYKISGDGMFILNKQPKNGMPTHIAPKDWRMDMGQGSTGKILVMLPMALLIL